jgi:hypothetical protein
MPRAVAVFFAAFLVSLASPAFAGLLGGGLVNPDEVCIFQSEEEARRCQEGSLAFFRPSSWGNAQTPLAVAAAYCDWSQQVMHTEAGVLCVFTKKRLHILNKAK